LRDSTLHWEGLCTVGDLCTHKIRASWSGERSEIDSSFLRMRNAFGSGLLKLFLVLDVRAYGSYQGVKDWRVDLHL